MISKDGTPDDSTDRMAESAQPPTSAPESSVPKAGEAQSRSLNFGTAATRSYLRTLNQFLQGKTGDRSVPYIYACSVSRIDADAISIEKFPGLLCCHAIIEANGKTHVYSYWGNHDSFELHRDNLKSVLLQPVDTLEGRVSQTYIKSKTLWERFPLWTVVITVSALIGALAGLWEQGARMIEPPDITVAFKRDKGPNFKSSDPRIIGFALTNQCRFASAAVRISSAVTREGEPANPLTENGRLSRIEPGKDAPFEIESSVKSTSHHGPPETYRLRLVVASTAGFWRGEKQFLFLSPPFTVWEPLGWSRPTKLRVTETACYLEGILYSGKDGQKTTGIVTVGMPTKVDSVVITISSGKTDIQSDVSPSGEVVRQMFTTDTLQPFLPYRFTIKVSSAGISNQSCDQLAQAPDIVTFR